ncbi:MAG: magnesium transporter [Marinifilaceae bacterium]
MQFELSKEFLDNLRELIKEDNKTAVQELLKELHPADVAEILEELDKEGANYVLLQVDNDTAADALAELDDEDREDLIESLPLHTVATRIIMNMDSDDAADMIGSYSDDEQQEILSYIHDIEQASDIVELLNYDDDTAGGLMGKEFVMVNENWTVMTCLRELTRQAEDIDEIYYVYVVNDDNKLKGTLSLKRMILSPTSAKIINIYNKDVISVTVDEESEEVSLIMEKYDLVAMPVTDSIGRVVGRITIDDVVDVIREGAEKDYQLASGISQDVDISDSILVQTKARLPWLVIGLVGGIFDAFIISNHESDIKIFPMMAFFIPLITAMGGNVGIQSSAIVVQGLANNSLGYESTFNKILKEFGRSVIIATICSLLLLGFCFLTSFGSLALTLSSIIALFIVIIFASIFGTFIPLALDKLKIDPALATGPFITMSNDIVGLFIYLAVGKMIFEYMA